MELELTLEREELGLLVLHMSVMRKAIKKGFKATYGLLDGRKKLKLFDEIKDKLSSDFDEDMDIFIFYLAADEIDMLASFLNWYVKELSKSTEELDAENKEILKILEQVNEKVCYLDELVTDEVLNQVL